MPDRFTLDTLRHRQRSSTFLSLFDGALNLNPGLCVTWPLFLCVSTTCACSVCVFTVNLVAKMDFNYPFATLSIGPMTRSPPPPPSSCIITSGWRSNFTYQWIPIGPGHPRGSGRTDSHVQQRFESASTVHRRGALQGATRRYTELETVGQGPRPRQGQTTTGTAAAAAPHQTTASASVARQEYLIDELARKQYTQFG